jgi:hypothetical protein
MCSYSLLLLSPPFPRRRIAFCLDVHNEAVKSMRYPPDEVYRKELANQAAGKGGKKEDKSDEKTIDELIKEMEEDEGMDE